MATRPRPKPHKHGTGKNQIIIWGDPAKVKTFFPDLTPMTDSDPVDRIQDVKAYKRRQYPGDTTPVNRDAGKRSVLKGGDYRTRATPGRAFFCEITTGTGSAAKTKATQFTVQGPFREVRVMAMLDAVTGEGPANWVLRSPGGKGYPIKKTTTAPALGQITITSTGSHA
jgi:hypothetical protein